MEDSHIRREPIEWCDIWIRGCTGTDLPRVLMIGDSITKSYFHYVDKALKGRFCCGQLATSKCVGDPRLIKEFELAFCEGDFEVIHFNNGMHGWDYTEKQYADGLAESFDWLIKTAPKARLIWAQTTPKREGEGWLQFNEEITERVRVRNRTATSLVEERGLEINDLFSVVVDRPDYFIDGVHFTPEGREALGKKVVEVIDQ
jgi:hypothetical protein